MSAIQQVLSSYAPAGAITYATWDPANKGSTIVLSSGNTVATGNFSSTDTSVRATVFKSSGKWYWECTMGGGSAPFLVGIANASSPLTNGIGQGANGWGYHSSSGIVYNNNSAWVSLSSVYGSGDVVAFVLDATNNSAQVYVNNVSVGSITGMTGPYTPAFGGGYPNANSVCTINSGGSAFVYPTRPTINGANPGLY